MLFRSRPQGKMVVAQPVDVAPDMDVEWTYGVMNAETVTRSESPIKPGGELVTEESIMHANSNPDFSQAMK